MRQFRLLQMPERSHGVLPWDRVTAHFQSARPAEGSGEVQRRGHPQAPSDGQALPRG